MRKGEVMGVKKGIDVSRYNGEIDWGRVKSDGVEFVIIRTGFGRENPRQKDSAFDENYSGAKKAGLDVGCYHYSYAVTPEQAREEAAFLLKIIGGKSFEYPIFFDIEDEVHLRLGKEECGRIIRAFCEAVERAGYWAGVYSYDSFFGERIGEDIQKRFSVWAARVENVKPRYAGQYGIWQYSHKGCIDGIRGRVDLNYGYIDYPKRIRAKGLNGLSGKSFGKIFFGDSVQKKEDLK